MLISIARELGSRYWAIRLSPTETRITCSGCSGDGLTRLLDGSRFDCPKCGGHGVLEVKSGEANWQVEKDVKTLKIVHVHIMGDSDTTRRVVVSYSSTDLEHSDYEVNCFSTLDKAQDACEVRNGKLNNKN